MKIKTIHLENFKKFTDLTINLGEEPAKIIAMVGPNGCGKSSVFDAFEKETKKYKGTNLGGPDESFYQKHETNPYQINITTNKEEVINKKSFYVRSPYRITTSLELNSGNYFPNDTIENDTHRPPSTVNTDDRLTESFSHLSKKIIDKIFDEEIKTNQTIKDETFNIINKSIESILDIQIKRIGDIENRNNARTIFFVKKNNLQEITYLHLSAGEKEVINIILDLVVKKEIFNNTIYCIDEPELHINTKIQRKLLIEIEKLIPDSCQLWVATHSIGFLRALQEDLKEKSQILDFSDKDFDKTETIAPIKTTRKNWVRIFETALEDLTGLIAPKTIIYCEGRKEPTEEGEEQGLDAEVYNEIFSENHADSLFVSSGGKSEIKKHSSIALSILNKAFPKVNLLLLKEMDNNTEENRGNFLKSKKTNRMLDRREIENYLFDKEILQKYCTTNQTTIFNEEEYDTKIKNIIYDKVKDIENEIKNLCKSNESIAEFKYSLANFITKETNTYKELENCIFSDIDK